MRYVLFSLVSTFSFHLAIAQVVITGETFTNAGDVLYFESASPDWNQAADAHLISGENQNWDVSNWDFLIESDEAYLNLSETPFAYQFFFNNEILYPENFSTHGQAVETGDLELPIPFEVSEPFFFYRNDEAGYYQTGNAFSVEGLPIITQNDISDRVLTFPLEYGNIDSTHSAFLTSVPLLGAYGQSGTRVSTVDGWGTITTPDGDYDVLRISAKRELTDTLFIEQFGTGQQIVRPIQFDFMWISPNVPGPILEMTVINDVVVSARMNAGTGTVNTAEAKLEGVTFFPNPAKDRVYIDWGSHSAGTMRIYSAQGKLLISENVVSDSIDISALPAGVYIAEFSSDSKTAFEQFVVMGD